VDQAGYVLEFAVFLIVAAAFLAVLAMAIKLCVADARKRGKSPTLVAIACIFFFPWGLLAWLVFRPDPIDRGGKERFRLEDHRVQ
jgi:hypothetical protein